MKINTVISTYNVWVSKNHLNTHLNSECMPDKANLNAMLDFTAEVAVTLFFGCVACGYCFYRCLLQKASFTRLARSRIERPEDAS